MSTDILSVPPFLKDKYFLLCLAISFIIIVSYVSFDDESSSGRVGIVHDVSESSSGFTFYFEQDDGTTVHCFWKNEPVEGLCSIKGSWSDDGTMFFVSSLTVLR